MSNSLHRVVRWLRPERVATGRARSALLLVGCAAFILSGWIGFTQLPPQTEPVNWWLMAVVPLLGVPLTVALNAAEYRGSARLVGQAVPMADAVEVSVLSTAANLLPVPGAVVVRSRALLKAGSRLGHAVTATTATGIAWLSVTLLVISALWLGTEPTLALSTGTAGAATFVTFVVLVRRLRPNGDRLRPARMLMLIELAAVAVAAARYLVIFAALGGGSVSVAQATALTSGAVVASALGLLPGGLGLREALVAGVAPLVGLASASGLAATAIDRVAGLLVLAIITAAMLAGRRARSASGVPMTVGPDHTPNT